MIIKHRISYFTWESKAIAESEGRQEEWVPVWEEGEEKEAMVLVAEQGLEMVEAAQVAVMGPEKSVGSAVAAMGRPRYAVREQPRLMVQTKERRSGRGSLSIYGSSHHSVSWLR